MTSPQHSSTMESLPDDVLSDIFIRLLAKQLAQMRCLCKSWNALLSESSFVKSHLHRSIHHNKDEILLLFPGGYDFNCIPFATRPSRSLHHKLTDFIKLPVPVNPQSGDSFGGFIGSVNGLICFYYRSDNYAGALHIWNPSLSAMLTLPTCSLPCYQLHFGFGFDPKTDDYKIVKLTSIYKPLRMLPEVEVYSMRKGSWELIPQRLPSHIKCIKDQNEVCVSRHDGHLHWLGYIDEKMKAQTIVAFDLGLETLCEISLPDSIGSRMNVLGVFAGKLCVIAKFRGGRCEVWVMDEYGVAESWVKRHTFSQFSSDIQPYGFTSHNESLFLYRDHNLFVLYDPFAAKGRRVFKLFDRLFTNSKVVEYVDSLVWVAPPEREMSCSNISQFQF